MTENPSENQSIEQALLAFVRQPGYRAMKPRLIAKKLHVAADENKGFNRLVKKLVKGKQLTYGANHLIVSAAPETAGAKVRTSPPAPSAAPAEHEEAEVAAPLSVRNKPMVASPAASAEPARKSPSHPGGITGVFRRAQAGYGFVRPAGTPRAAAREHDIYIAAADTGDAASGDTVLIKPAKGTGRGGQPRGVIVEVLERETFQFVGTYFETAGSAMVQVDGTLFTQPISVGDPGAKNAQPGDKVVFEMVRFPSHTHDGEGVISEVLGPRGAPGVDTLSIIREFNLPGEFAEDVLAAARTEASRFDESIPPHRLDLTGETVITIDPVDARDFDDAISLERLENGHWRLGVHIADVSHFVRPGSPLDREAHHRATSVYLPDRVIPMLPEVISNGLASLQPDRVRYTKTAIIEFTAEGVQVAVDLHTSAIKSKRRFTYEEVDDYLADADAWKKKLTPQVHGLLGRMHELAMILRARRFRRGALELSLGEVKVDLDPEGRVTGAHKVVNTVSHQIIEEFMLSANEAVASTFARAELNFLRRIHQAPDPRKLKALTEFVAELGVKTESLESRFEIQRLLNLVADRPERQAVNYAVLRSLAQAVYSPVDEGHYALASDCYCHFTSPIRRYPDLTIHRLIDGLLAKKKSKTDMTELVVLGEHCSERERRAESAERELTKVKLLEYLSERVGEEMDAVITGVEEFGLFAQGLALPAEGLIHISSLADDYYHFERRSHTLTGRRSGNAYRLGDVVRVCVARVDVDRRVLDFRVVQRLKHPPRVEKPGRAVPPTAGDDGRASVSHLGAERGGKPAKGKHAAGSRGHKPAGNLGRKGRGGPKPKK